MCNTVKSITVLLFFWNCSCFGAVTDNQIFEPATSSAVRTSTIEPKELVSASTNSDTTQNARTSQEYQSYSWKNSRRITTEFRLQVFENDEPTDKYLVGIVSLSKQDSGQIFVDWEDVIVWGSTEKRATGLWPEHIATTGTFPGSISNVTVDDNGAFHFVMDLGLGPTSSTPRSIRVDGYPINKILDSSCDEPFCFFDIQAHAVWEVAPRDQPKQNIKIEWKSIHEIDAPYRRIIWKF